MALTGSLSRSVTKARKRSRSAAWIVTPAAMAWPPPLIASPASTAARTAQPEIDAGHGAAGAGRGPVGIEGEGESRAAEPLLHPGGDQAHDPRMPLGRGRHEDRPVRRRLEGEHRLRLGLGHRHDLDRLTLAVEPVELGGKLRGLDGILASAAASSPSAASPIRPPALMRGPTR